MITHQIVTFQIKNIKKTHAGFGIKQNLLRYVTFVPTEIETKPMFSDPIQKT